MFKRFCLLQVFNYSRVQDFKDIKGILWDANNCEQVTKTVDKNQRPKTLFNKMENQLRHIRNPKRTTISLETDFWQQIEVLARQRGLNWRQWSEDTLTAKPLGTNSASWLRVNCLLRTKEFYGEKSITC